MSLVEESKDEISIHAAREGGDPAMYPPFLRIDDFNPRRP